MMKIRACVGVLAVAACSFAVAADDAFLLVSAKVTSRDGQVLMNVSTAIQDGSSLPLERGKRSVISRFDLSLMQMGKSL